MKIPRDVWNEEAAYWEKVASRRFNIKDWIPTALCRYVDMHVDRNCWDVCPAAKDGWCGVDQILFKADKETITEYVLWVKRHVHD